MKKSELIRLKSMLKKEISRRERINQLLDSKDVLDYLYLTGESTDKKDLIIIREILKEILKDFSVTETNGIYVCTKAFDEDSRAPVIYYNRPDCKCGVEHKCYMDIESKEEIETDWIYGPSINEFETSHIVLNPYNTPYDDKKIKANGYEDVRLDFFEESCKNGQSKAVQMILKKYPRIGSYK